MEERPLAPTSFFLTHSHPQLAQMVAALWLALLRLPTSPQLLSFYHGRWARVRNRKNLVRGTGSISSGALSCLKLFVALLALPRWQKNSGNVRGKLLQNPPGCDSHSTRRRHCSPYVPPNAQRTPLRHPNSGQMLQAPPWVLGVASA